MINQNVSTLFGPYNGFFVSCESTLSALFYFKTIKKHHDFGSNGSTVRAVQTVSSNKKVIVKQPTFQSLNLHMARHQ